MLRSLCLFTLLMFAAPVCAEVKLDVTPDRSSGTYSPGETVTWTVIAKNEDGRPVSGTVNFRLLAGSVKEVSSGKSELQEGKATVSGTRNEPGTLLARIEFRPKPDQQAVISLGGAVFAPEKIQPSLPPPDDFDQFWEAKIAALRAVPMNTQLEKVEVNQPGVEYYKITFDNILGRKIRGHLAKPIGDGPFPAQLRVQAAGVYPLKPESILGAAKQGWLVLNISAHDLPIDDPIEVYQDKHAVDLKDYRIRGNADRETSYFLPMFLGCIRAVDYLTERPDWNRKTLFVFGGSQGGYQAIVTAGLHPAVTGMAGNVPAGCDHTGIQVGRQAGWPNWSGASNESNIEKTTATSRYFDAMNFARRIQCPALIGVGLIDSTCPPEGIFATFNQIQGPKQIVIMPKASHSVGYAEPYNPELNKMLNAQKSLK